jgi:hypothetical protein
MSLRVILLVVCALWGWDVATPIQPLAQTIVWDEEEEVSRAAPTQLARPSVADDHVSPMPTAHRGLLRRIVHHATSGRRAYHHAPVPPPRARMDAALVDSPSEDH